ncbi:hypothetical protein, partial [Candidatus Deferrimicrobium sp.]|uniref:hypothetical protein n=1 Tax=Candidatus Deferrimicrobium sp. TaxID=3060586 RepID=UPI003C5CD59F
MRFCPRRILAQRLAKVLAFERIRYGFVVRFALAAACLFAFLLAVHPVPAGAAEAPRPLLGGADAIPVPRPG